MLEHHNKPAARPSRVVILGAKGFVGSTVAARLEALGVDVLPLGRQELDLMDEAAAGALGKILAPSDALLVISAQAPVKNNTMLENNIRMMSTVCAALQTTIPAHVVYVSSDAVYADIEKPMDESSCAEPTSLHGVMHLAREVMLKSAYSGPLGIIRPTLIYGLNDPHNGYGPNRFRRLAAAGKDIVLFGEGEERRDHILVDDVAELIARMLVHRSSGVLNAATGRVVSFREIADMIVSHFEGAVAIHGSPRVGPMPHNGYRAFNPSQTREAFPDFAYTDIADGLARVHRAMMENV